MSDYSSYDEAIQAILDAQTDVDNKYKSIGNASSTLCDVNQTMLQIPDGSVVRNRGGEVIGYDYKYTTPKLPDIGIIAVDSNTDSGTFGEHTGGGGHSSGGGAGRYRGSYYAGEVVDDPQSTDKMKGSGLVSGVVSAAWAAGSVLSKLGKTVASVTADVLEEVDAHFGLNYGPLAVDFGYGTADMANAVRALFGVDSQGNTTMYLEEDVIGALAIQTKEDGFFDDGGDKYATYDGDKSRFPAGFPDEIILSSPAMGTGGYYGANLYTYGAPDAIMAYVQGSNNTPNQWVAISDRPFTAYTYINGNVSRSIAASTSQTVNSTTYYKVTYNMSAYSPRWVNLPSVIYPYNEMYIATYVIDGVIHTPQALPGVSDQTGATIPVDAITGADPHVVAQNLESNYPQVMGTPVQIVVMDDSCNPVTKKYYSVPISYSPTNLNINAPITGGLQVSPSFNPDVSLDLPDIDMDNYIDQVIKILGGSGAGRDVTVEPVPEDDPDAPSDTIPASGVTYEPPDTGTGETPPSTLPSVVPTSLWHIYNPSTAEISALGQWLWAGGFNIDTLRKILNNPMDCIIGLHALYGAPQVSGTDNILLGNVESPVSANIVSSQYTSVDCGSVWLTEYFGNVFDYEPFTQVSMFLPFIGIVKLSVADVMRANIAVKYNIDVFTGACNAQVIITRDGAGGVLYQFGGHCAVEYPITGATYNNLFQSMISISLGAAVLASGAGFPIAAAGTVASSAAATASAWKESIQRSGSFGGNVGAMGSKKPYLIITRPIPEMAINFEEFDGLPANKQVRLDACSGYTKCKEVHLNVPGAYKSELDELERLLRSGVIL